MNPGGAVVLRLAGAGDAPAMAAMSRDLIETGLRWRYTPQRMAALIRDADTVALVACDDAGLQGFAVMQFGDERAHLALLCVQPALRRRGLARQLIEWLLRSARVAGIEAVELELRADNDAAHAFYRRAGFGDAGLVPAYYGGRVAARRMRLVLRVGAGSAPPA